MIILGLILFLVGWLLKFRHHVIVMDVGIIVLVVGLVLLVLGRMGRTVAGRRYWW